MPTSTEAFAEQLGLSKNMATGMLADRNKEVATAISKHVDSPRESFMFFKEGNTESLTGSVNPDSLEDPHEFGIFINLFMDEFFEFSAKKGMNFDGLDFFALICGPRLFVKLCGTRIDKIIEVVPSNTRKGYDFQIQRRTIRRCR